MTKLYVLILHFHVWLRGTKARQDELAEHQCPSPQPFEGPYIEYDPYEYWEDLKYLSDGGYHDVDAPGKKRKTAAVDGSKSKTTGKTASISKKAMVKQQSSRKRKATEAAPKTQKRQKTARGKGRTPQGKAQEVVHSEREPMIVWRSNEERNALLSAVPVLKDNTSASITIASTFQATSKATSHQTLKADVNTEDEAVPPSPPSPQDDTPAVAGEGFDLNNLGAIAGLLTAEHLDTLKSILEAQGLSRDALDVVLWDLMEGRDPEYEEDEEEGDDG